MRMSRTFIAALAFCTVGLVPLTTASSAHSAEPRGKAPDASVEMAALPGRRVKFEFKQQDSSSYKFYGKVQGAQQKKKVILLRATSKEGKYRPFRTARTNARGHYSWSHLRAVGWFYLKVPGDRQYATSYSKLIHVHYR